MNDKFTYAYGDESGDTGFSFEHGASRYFSIALLLTNHPEQIRRQIERLRATLGLSAQTEFKFYKMPHHFRTQFLSVLQPLPFIAYVILVDKTKLTREWAQMSVSLFYARCLTELTTQIPENYLDKTSLILDQFGPLTITKTAIRRELKRVGIRPFKHIKMKRSQGNDLIQCADMVAGATARGWERQDKQFLQLIENKVTIWQFPDNKNPPS